MQPLSYSYCLLRYLHDPSLGEAVNVGVLVYAPEANFVRFVMTHRTKPLSALFRGFDRRSFLLFLSRLERSVERFQRALIQSNSGLFEMTKKPEHAGELANWLLCDNGLSFQFSEPKGGITHDPLSATKMLEDRILLGQRPAVRAHQRRDEDAVWATFQHALQEQGIMRHLTAHIVETSEFPLPFDHAYKNERWHAIEPISFDYARPDEIRDTAMRWYAYGAALQESDEFGSLYLLLGAPRNPDHLKAYEQAKKWLNKMPIEARIFEETQATKFAHELSDLMKEEGILENPYAKTTTQ